MVTTITNSTTSPRNEALVYDPRLVRSPPPAAMLLLFAIAYAALIVIGREIREESRQLAIVWPSAGLLFAVLWLTPRRLWPAIVAAQWSLEIAINLAFDMPSPRPWILVLPLANTIDALTGAYLQQRWIAEPALPRIRQVLQFLAATALGAAAGACLGAYAASRHLADPSYWRVWQIWWAGNWLGSLCTAPLVLMWWIRYRTPALSTRHRSMWEVALIGGGVLAACIWIFSRPAGEISTIFNLPSTLFALLVLASFRLPPRNLTVLAATVVIVAGYLSSHHLGPFAGGRAAFTRVGALQTYLATIVIVTYMLSVVLLEMRAVMLSLRRSEERYRHFIELSTEAVWRIEIRTPMPLDLPTARQVEWLREHGYVAECNTAYHRLEARDGRSETTRRLWHMDIPWAGILLERLEEAADRGYSMDGLRFEIDEGGKSSTFLTAFSGVAEQGRLVRIWGVARDVTELVTTSENLRRERMRLREYAWELGQAEERARRAAAVDLHDGIGQLLAAIQFNLLAARNSEPRKAMRLIAEAETALTEVQRVTRDIIADLSPPGLYELGLGAALRWLASRVASQNGLSMELNLRLSEDALSPDWRIFAFKIIRELVQNVVKHAGVSRVEVSVAATAEQLEIAVSDRGVGFAVSPLDAADERRGFGLWSIADRVRAVDGECRVDSAPGSGCRVAISVRMRSRAVEAHFDSPPGALHGNPAHARPEVPAAASTAAPSN